MPEPNTGFTAIAAGGYHSLGLKQDGSIVAWGDNDDGQCNVPEPNTGFTAIAAGDVSLAWPENRRLDCGLGMATITVNAMCRRPIRVLRPSRPAMYHSLGLKQDGSIVAWGNNEYGQCNVPEPNTGFTAIAAGWYHSLGLKQMARLWPGETTGTVNAMCRRPIRVLRPSRPAGITRLA